MKFVGESALKKLISLIKGDISKNKVTVDSSLTDNGTNPVQGKVIKSYVDDKLSGLTGAMHFIGKATIDITDGSTTDPAISGYDFANNKAKGDVILGKDDHKEFVWDGTKWELLGDEGSYALKTELNTKVSKSGDTFSGTLTYNGPSTDIAINLNGDAGIGSAKSFQFSGPLDKIDITPLSDVRGLKLLSNDADIIVSGIATPTSNNHAVNKAYVDAKVPVVTTANNGQFLRVVNGVPTWVALTNVAVEGA